MFKNDYIMDMIEQMTTVIGKVLFLKSKSKYSECHEVVNTTMTNFYGFGRDILLRLPDQELIELASNFGKADEKRCYVLTQLLVSDAQVCEQEGNIEDALTQYSQALKVLLTLHTLDNIEDAELINKSINDIIELTPDIIWDNETLKNLIKFYEETGRFSLAEDTLFNYADNCVNIQDVLETGTTLYQRMMLKSEEELDDGNFSHDEVVQGLTALWKKCTGQVPNVMVVEEE